MTEFTTSVEVEEDYKNLGKCDLKWGYDIEARSWGVKDVSISVPGQKVVCKYEEEVETADDLEYQKKEKEIQLADVIVMIEGLELSGSSFSFYPEKIEIDSKRKQTIVIFKLG